MKDDYVATDHLLVAIATVESPAQKVLTDAGLTADGLREAITAVRGNRRVTSEAAEASYESLEKYSVDLTQAAEDGRLDPVIGRDAEIRRVVQVLSRRTKNNPVLIGEPGVGKTAVVEGLAQRVVAGDVPDSLKGRRVLQPRPGRDGGGREVPRRVRGAAQGRARGDQGRRRSGHHLHRRAAHGRRRGRRRRLRDGRRQHAQADARARRAAHDRRDHAGRVPRAHREGPGAGAPLPAGLRRRAHASRTRSRSCAASRRSTRRTTASGSPTPRSSPPRRCPTATSPAASCPTRRSTSSTRPSSRLRMEHESSPEEIDQLRRQVERLKMEEFALAKETDDASVERLDVLRQRPRRPRGGAARARGALGAREGPAPGRGRAPPPARPAQDRGRQEAARGRPRGRLGDPATARSPSSRSRSPRSRRPRPSTSSRWSARRSAPSRSPTSSRPGPASPPARCCRARPPSSSRWSR